MSSLTSAFNKAHKWLLKWPGLFGVPFYVFMLGGIGTAAVTNPNAGLIEGAGVFYSNIFNTAANQSLTGLGILLKSAFHLVADTILPGVGTAISALTDMCGNIFRRNAELM